MLERLRAVMLQTGITGRVSETSITAQPLTNWTRHKQI